MTTTLYVPGTDEKDHKKQNMSLQLIGGQTATNTDAIAALQSGTVTTIAGNSGAFTLNATTGITNSANDIQLEQASASQFGAVKVDGTTITASSGVISAAPQSWVLLNTLTASSSATLSDTTSLTSTYAEYEIVFINIVAATAGGQQLELQVHSGGAFKTTGYLTNVLHSGNAATAVTNPTTFIPITSSGVVGSTATTGFSGIIRVSNVSQTSSPKFWYGGFGTSNNGSVGFIELSGGAWTGGNGAIDGFQVLMGTGNIASGTIKIYGRL